MTIDNKVLENLEKLSMLKIDENKKEALAGQLTEILEYIENLEELDTSKLDAAFSTLAGGTPMREDKPNNNPQIAKDIFSHAPHAENDFFIVPKIIE
ncbi:MAG: Asp-tRNA(Asn)/Glu-tRNA(Gln) amidotransferase subunit GatC [Epsilonproteobacteria bacterium]|nr:Asp-tRNA(Asn)/Glu-tRNA(Gln) amidotransferase subunit GatC [Campylobacterota bacterium]